MKSWILLLAVLAITCEASERFTKQELIDTYLDDAISIVKHPRGTHWGVRALPKDSPFYKLIRTPSFNEFCQDFRYFAKHYPKDYELEFPVNNGYTNNIIKFIDQYYQRMEIWGNEPWNRE